MLSHESRVLLNHVFFIKQQLYHFRYHLRLYPTLRLSPP
nr:MAG TPA: hypothetical protein [Caudoviricetes sp.]